MIVTTILISNLSVGLLSSGHCLGMCGGISSALGMGVQATTRLQRWSRILAYNLGRILTYALLGLLVGTLSMHLLPPISFWRWPRLLSALLMVLMGLYLAGWSRLLVYLEALGTPLWRRIAPYARRLLPLRHLPQSLLAGMLWGFLPCGMVYAALTLAASSADSSLATMAMLAFGLGTLPMMLLAGGMAQRLQRFLSTYHLRQISGILLIGLGLWTALAVGMMQHDMMHHVMHGQPMPMQMSMSAMSAMSMPADARR